MLDVTAYYTANESSLGVKLRRFHQWFREYEDDLQKIVKKAEPKPKKSRHQNKVVCQAEWTRWTATQKNDGFYQKMGQDEGGESQSHTERILRDSTREICSQKAEAETAGPPPGPFQNEGGSQI